jgi:glucosamine--fructose-6-phosphate aminotransferase (isomerizing)
MGFKNGKGDKVNKFLQEILEQPESLHDTLKFYEKDEGKELLNQTLSIYRKKKITDIIFTGMGSSFFTSYVASCLLNEYGIRSYVINTSELLHYHISLLNENTLLVCVSQSGESFEIVEILSKLASNVTCLGITNDKSSTLAKNVPALLLSRAGKEEMTSTKTFISTTLVMLILGWSLSGNWDSAKIDEVKRLIVDIENLLQTHSEWAPAIIEFLGDYCFLQIIGRGPSYSAALQGSLMFKEAARNPAEGILGGEFRHGPMEMVNRDFKAIVFAPIGKTFEQSINMAKNIAEFQGKVVLITNADIKLTFRKIHMVKISESDEFLFTIPGIIPVQLVVNQLALNKGFKPGYFNRGAKVTTIE